MSQQTPEKLHNNSSECLISPVDACKIINEEYRDLYSRFVRVVGARFAYMTYRIKSKIQLMMSDGELGYFFKEIEGNLGVSNGEIQGKFKVILENGDLIFEEGDLSTFSKAIDMAEADDYKYPRCLPYKRYCPPHIENEIHNWMMRGCPVKEGLTYELTAWLDRITISSISKDNIKLEVSPNYVHVIESSTQRKWTFGTEVYANAHQIGTDYLKPSSECIEYMNIKEYYCWVLTDETKQEGLQLLQTIAKLLD